MTDRLSHLSGADTLIIFFHGLGDSHLNDHYFFDAPSLLRYDLCVVDLLRHGKSSSAHSYTFNERCQVLFQAEDYLVWFQTFLDTVYWQLGQHDPILQTHYAGLPKHTLMYLVSNCPLLQSIWLTLEQLLIGSLGEPAILYINRFVFME